MVNEIKGGGNHELSTDIQVITAEINAYQRVAGEAIFEIGRRLKHVKENDLAHGEWTKWLGGIGMTQRHARRFITVYERFSKRTPESDLPNSITVLEALTSLTDEELEQTYELPSGETKKPTEMSRREIEALREDGYADTQIVYEIESDNAPQALSDYFYDKATPDELMRALVIGYEIEKSPEEKLREYYESFNAKIMEHVYARTAIRTTLDLLGITIEGINA